MDKTRTTYEVKLNPLAIRNLGRSSELQAAANQIGAAIISHAIRETAVRTGNLRASWDWEVTRDGTIHIGSGPVSGRLLEYAAAYLFGHPHTSWQGNNVLWQGIEATRAQGIHKITRRTAGGEWRTVYKA